MKKSKNKNSPKPRNWLALHAKGLTGRRGAGVHKSKKRYLRKSKHKTKYENE